jgi:hypothetical protein
MEILFGCSVAAQTVSSRLSREGPSECSIDGDVTLLHRLHELLSELGWAPDDPLSLTLRQHALPFSTCRPSNTPHELAYCQAARMPLGIVPRNHKDDLARIVLSGSCGRCEACRAVYALQAKHVERTTATQRAERAMKAKDVCEPVRAALVLTRSLAE